MDFWSSFVRFGDKACFDWREKGRDLEKLARPDLSLAMWHFRLGVGATRSLV